MANQSPIGASEIASIYQFFGCILLLLYGAILVGDFAAWAIVRVVAWFDRRRK